MLLIIDNYDSFTYNLFQYLSELRQEVKVVRNDKTTLAEIESMAPQRIVISPGPSTPLNAGISNDVIKHFGERMPILGVCLGHQCIGHSYGGVVGPAKDIMHGKSSLIYHNSCGQRRPARLSGIDRLDGGRDDYGHAPPPTPGGGRPVPPRVLYDPPRQGHTEELFK
jgi:anthranilate synthase/aminodeoxychorismate synthase-like glutamine amidotransferase